MNVRKLLKRLLVPVLTSRPITALATRLYGVGDPVFMLHRMASDETSRRGKISPSHLRRCLQYLADNRYEFISLEQLILAIRNEQPLPHKPVVFTLDDGYIDQAEVAAPIFLEFDCPATMFVITGMLDQNLWPWDAKLSWIIDTTTKHLLKTSISGKRLDLIIQNDQSRRLARYSIQDVLRKTEAGLIPDILDQLAREAGVEISNNPPDSYLPMDWDIARRLEKQGIQFAPHSVTHRTLSRLDESSLDKEIQHSWRTLNNELKRPVKIFCYPTGREADFGEREIKALAHHDYMGAVTSTPGFIDLEDKAEKQLFRLPRFGLPEAIDDFIQYCTWIEYVKKHH